MWERHQNVQHLLEQAGSGGGEHIGRAVVPRQLEVLVTQSILQRHQKNEEWERRLQRECRGNSRSGVGHETQNGIVNILQYPRNLRTRNTHQNIVWRRIFFRAW